MGILSKLFGRKKSFASVLANMQNSLFKIYGMDSATDAQKMKASVYLCISALAILNDLGGDILNDQGGDKLRKTIDTVVDETRELTKPLSMRVKELANNETQLEKILAGFPNEVPITGSTSVNGLAAFEAMYFGMGQELMHDMLAHKKGPMGVPGYAAIVVVDGIFGEGESKKHYMDITMAFMNFMRKLIEAI